MVHLLCYVVVSELENSFSHPAGLLVGCCLCVLLLMTRSETNDRSFPRSFFPGHNMSRTWLNVH